MSRGINKVILVGNLGKDPEIRHGNNGSTIANFSLATSESWKDKETREPVERTEWHKVVMYSQLADLAKNYLHKGSKIYIEGKIKTRKWQDKTTLQDRYTTEIIADSMQMLDSKGKSDEPPFFPGETGTYSRPVAQAEVPVQAHVVQSPRSVDEDVPF